MVPAVLTPSPSHGSGTMSPRLRSDIRRAMIILLHFHPLKGSKWKNTIETISILVDYFLFITYLFPGPAIVCQGSTHPRQMCVSQTRCFLEVRLDLQSIG